MILLKANAELEQTFERLIQTMKVPVKWNGIFVVVDNYIILQGEVRSLFFHFDTRKAATNIIEFPVQEQIPRIIDNVRVQNAINMILYSFGKWGTIGGIRVEKNYEQLNGLFRNIMQEFGVEPEYTPSYFRFYRKGMRITYEDVVQMALEYEDENEVQTGERTRGLWRKIVWKRERADFTRVETSVEERKGGRLGSNFYMVGYLCPECGKKLHMVVYPAGKEFRIETEEGGVLLARACTCDQCSSFYTPRPKKLLAEGDVYTMQFGDDRDAYEDYLELLGRDGDRVSNCRCNEFADGRNVREGAEEEEPLEELLCALPELSDLELRKLTARMEEGFYPDESIKKCERQVREQQKIRQMDGKSAAPGSSRRDGGMSDRRDSGRTSGNADEKSARESSAGKSGGKTAGGIGEKTAGDFGGRTAGGIGEKTAGDFSEKTAGEIVRQTAVGAGGETVRGAAGSEKRDIGTESRRDGSSSGERQYVDEIIMTPEEREEVKRKYEARLQVLDRYSERQLKELRSQLERERKLMPEERNIYLEQVEQKLIRERAARLTGKVDACEGKSYLVMKRVSEEVEDAELPPEVRQPLLKKLNLWKRKQAEREVEQLVAKMPANLDRNQYKKYLERIRDYEEVNLAPYEEKLQEGRMAAERQEIAGMVKRARKVSREDLEELAAKLREGDFLPELVSPYLEKVEDKIRQLDEEEIALICPNPMQLSFAEGMQAYQQIEQGNFLPELKADALKMLSKRLAKIKTDECELLVGKLKSELEEAGIKENDRHHFYPARRALLHQAAPEETEVIEFALASYAAGKGMFEYPILVVDVTRSGTGKEGMILTPDHLYYSTMLSAYGIPIDSVDRISASTGLLNKGLYVHQKNGTKTKLPYAVEGKELPVFAEVLDSFVHYLQEKPDSRSLTYLAREKHETICCFRCGYEYKGGTVCPKCGYQNNG